MYGAPSTFAVPAMIASGTSTGFVAIAVGLALGALWIALICRLYAIPMRWRERGLLLVDLLDAAAAEGGPMAESIRALHPTPGDGPGQWFRRLQAALDQGATLPEAILAHARGIPPAVLEQLALAPTLADPRPLLAGCRRQLDSEMTVTRSAGHFLPVILLPLPFFTFVLCWGLQIFIYPMLDEVFADLSGVPHVAAPGFPVVPVLDAVVKTLWVLTAMLTAGYVLRRLGRRFGLELALPSALSWPWPWVRVRALRAFAVTTAALLDAGIDESSAVTRAAQCAANGVVLRRAKRATADLAAGRPFPDVLDRVDPSGELSWRFRAAASSPDGFARSLRTWGELQESRAFRSEQVAAQLWTTGIVLLVAVTVGWMCVDLFSMLVRTTEVAALW